jgi:DNA-binding transcriptional LysR family regulator
MNTNIDKIVRNIDWDRLKIFYYIVKFGSQIKAASYLNLTQPSLSRVLTNLERSLDAKLINNNFKSKGVSLTEEGKILFEAVEGIFAKAEEALTRIEECRKSVIGKLNLCSTAGFASHYLPKYLPLFKEKYPGVDITVLSSDEIPASLVLSHAGALIHPFIGNRSDLTQLYLMTVHLKLYASSTYLEQHGVPENVQDLNRHQLIAFTTQSDHPFEAANWHLTAGLPAGQRRKAAFEIDSTQARISLAQAHQGIIVLSQEHPGLDKTNLVEVLSDVPCPSIEVYYIFSKNLSYSRKIVTFGEFLQEELHKDYNS